MKHLFYLIGIFYLIHELTCLYSPIIQGEKVRRFISLTKGRTNLNGLNEEDNKFVAGKFFTSFLYLGWFITGLLTFNWVAFLILLICGFFIMSPLERLTINTKLFIPIYWFHSLLGFLFALFVIINSYHLKIDLFQLLSSLWK